MNKSVFLNCKKGAAQLGQSKFFGNPDLPDEFDWPVDSEEYDMDFICQINCREASKYNSLLPESGMLYFFGCIANPLGQDDAPPVNAGFQIMTDFAVIYEDIEEKDLLSGEIVDENGEEVGFGELLIDFSNDEWNSSEAFHKMLGDFPEKNNDISDYMLLFCLDSFSGDDFTLEFEQSGYLYFLIKKDDLLNKDFSKVMCYLSI